MVNELRSRWLSPVHYYKLYNYALHELQPLAKSLASAPAEELAALYRFVQQVREVGPPLAMVEKGFYYI